MSRFDFFVVIKKSAFMGVMGSFLLGCSLPKPVTREDQNLNASFYVESVAVTAAEAEAPQLLPFSNKQNFRVAICVREMRTARPLINHQFEAFGQNLTSDGSGCVNLTHGLEFNPWADARFLRVQSVITAKGIHKGSRPVMLALNPWEAKGFDLEKSKVEGVVETANVNEALTKVGAHSKIVFVQNPKISIIERQLSNQGLQFTLSVEAAPRSLLKKASGEVTERAWTQGDFTVKAELLEAETSASQPTQVIEFAEQQLRVTNGLLRFEAPFTLAKLCTRGHYLLSLSLKPKVPAVKSLMTVQSHASSERASFLISSCDSLKGTHTGQIIESSSLLNQTVVGTAGGQHQSTQVQVANFTAQDLNSQLGSGSVRSRQLRLGTCLTSSSDNQPLKHVEIEIENLSRPGEVSKAVTNEKGCLEWRASYSFNFLEKECEEVQNLRFRNKNLGLDVQASFNLNLWKNAGDTIRNTKSAEQSLKAPACADQKLKGHLARMVLTAQDVQPEIDQFLNLRVRRVLNFNLFGSLARPTIGTRDGRDESTAYPPGEYLLRLVVLNTPDSSLRPNKDNIVFATEKVVSPSPSGWFADRLEAGTEQLRFMANVGQLFVQLIPKEATDGDFPVFSGGFRLSSEVNDLMLVPAQNFKSEDFVLAKRLIAEREKEAEATMRSLSQKSNLAKSLSLTLINMNQPEQGAALAHFMRNPKLRDNKPMPAVPLHDLQSWIDSGQNAELNQRMLNDLCNYFVYDFYHRPIAGQKQTPLVAHSLTMIYGALRECRDSLKASATGIFDIQRRNFVKAPRVLGIERKPKARLSTLALTTSIDFAHSWSKSFSESSSVGFAVGLGIMNKVAGQLEGGKSLTWSDYQSASKSEAASQARTLAFNLEEIQLRVRAAEHERCVLIRVRPEAWVNKRFDPLRIIAPKRKDSFTPSALASMLNERLSKKELVDVTRKGLMLCQGQSQGPLEFTESYFTLSPILPGEAQTTMVNASDNRELFSHIRGVSDFVSYMSFLSKDFELPLELKSQFSGHNVLTQRTAAHFMNLMPGAPAQFIDTNPEAAANVR